MWYTENSNVAQSENADCLQQKTGSCQIMKFKTKLAITFLTIILLPVLLSLCAFLGIGTIMMRSGGQTTYDEGMRAYSMMSESIDAFSQATDELFDTIQEQARENTHRLEDKAYLDKLNEEAADKSSYIIIRKGDQIYYAGNAAAAQQIFSRSVSYTHLTLPTNREV